MKYKLALGFAVVCLTACNGETESLGEGGAGGGVTFAPTAMCPLGAECRLTPIGAGKADCDDGDPLTSDRCVLLRPCLKAACVHIPSECDALDPYQVQQAICGDDEECTHDRCERGVCMNHPLNDGLACSLGTCQSGVCVD
jgi:hypothetical protein